MIPACSQAQPAPRLQGNESNPKLCLLHCSLCCQTASTQEQRHVRYFIPTLVVVNRLCSNPCFTDRHKPSFMKQLQNPLKGVKQVHLTFPYRHHQQHDQRCVGCSLISIINLHFFVTYVQNTSPSAAFPCTSPE